LSALTDGLHMHRIEYEDVANLEKAKIALKELHILYED
jgi:transcriptional regulator of NAD metabolism